MAAIPKKKPVVRVFNIRSLVTAIDGKEKPYPVYRFSGRVFVERPKHNPFTGL